ncbi:hypothetical protein ANCDUO_02968 [Ancylostoma duodenale]|uniref:Uncharacterized protein n=1 Tax=Ancylostoma duodenale TaxID=51022 RepID=A0A0C2HB16_9BILA|nr:hypothetical protein ANCDUO_02968 [Ancylostoma duodenale]
MFRTYEHGCKQYKPTLRLICSILSLTISLCEFALAVYEYSYSRGGNIIAAIFTCVFSFHGCITLLYFIGIIRRNPCLLVPFLTLQSSEEKFRVHDSRPGATINWGFLVVIRPALLPFTK